MNEISIRLVDWSAYSLTTGFPFQRASTEHHVEVAFLNSLCKTKHELISNESINHSLMVSVSQLFEPFAFSKSRGDEKIKVFKTFEFGRPCLRETKMVGFH